MKRQNEKIKSLPYYSFGGGAGFKWYHSIIAQTSPTFENASIPRLKHKKIKFVDQSRFRLIIATKLTSSSFPDIHGFPWHFVKHQATTPCLTPTTKRHATEPMHHTKRLETSSPIQA